MLPSRSFEWTSAGWPRYAQQFIIASRGQPVSPTYLQRLALNTVSINKHFKTEGWLIPALMALPIAIGLIAAIFFA